MAHAISGRADGTKESGAAPAPPEESSSGATPPINYVIVLNPVPAMQRRVWCLLGLLVILCLGLAVAIWRELLKDLP